MEDDGAMQPRIPFPAGKAGSEFTQGVADHIQRLVEANMACFIPPENVLRYRHGEAWSIRRADASTDVGQFSKVDVVRSVHHEDFVNNDLGKLLEIFQEYIREFTQKNEEMVVETTSAAAESVGNEVSASGSGAWAEAFLESLEKIKLSADRHGNVNMPQILVSPETGEEMRAELESQGPAYERRVDAVLREKAEEARSEELARLSNYEGISAPE